MGTEHILKWLKWPSKHCENEVSQAGWLKHSPKLPVSVLITIPKLLILLVTWFKSSVSPSATTSTSRPVFSVFSVEPILKFSILLPPTVKLSLSSSIISIDFIFEFPL